MPERKKTRKELVDKRLAEAEEDVRKGRVHGPYDSAAKTAKVLRRRSR